MLSWESLEWTRSRMILLNWIEIQKKDPSVHQQTVKVLEENMYRHVDWIINRSTALIGELQGVQLKLYSVLHVTINLRNILVPAKYTVEENILQYKHLTMFSFFCFCLLPCFVGCIITMNIALAAYLEMLAWVVIFTLFTCCVLHTVDGQGIVWVHICTSIHTHRHTHTHMYTML